MDFGLSAFCCLRRLVNLIIFKYSSLFPSYIWAQIFTLYRWENYTYFGSINGDLVSKRFLLFIVLWHRLMLYVERDGRFFHVGFSNISRPHFSYEIFFIIYLDYNNYKHNIMLKNVACSTRLGQH